MKKQNTIETTKEINRDKFEQDLQHINCPLGNKTSWQRRNGVSLYVPATSQVRPK